LVSQPCFFERLELANGELTSTTFEIFERESFETGQAMTGRALAILGFLLGATALSWGQSPNSTQSKITTSQQQTEQDSEPANTSTLQQKKKDQKFSADWRLRLYGVNDNDEQTQAKYVALRLDLRSKYILTSSLVLDLQPSLRLVSGTNQSIDGADTLENRFLLNQAAAHYTPVDGFRLSAGALNQRYMHSRLLIDEISFPAARAMGYFKNSAFDTGLAIESAIPTSTSLSTNTKDLEPTPSLNSAMLFFNWGDHERFWKTRAGYFIYKDLPSAVAQQSKILGNNSVGSLSDADYFFTQKYQGIEASTEVQVPVITSLDFTAEADYLRNDQVSAEDSTAWLGGAGTIIHFSRNIDWSLKGIYFSIAPEAAVAYFNARNFETNRVGYGLETYLSFKKEGFKLGLEYKDAEVMFENPVQSRQRTLWIKLETFYVNI